MGARLNVWIPPSRAQIRLSAFGQITTCRLCAQACHPGRLRQTRNQPSPDLAELLHRLIGPRPLTPDPS
jgi:hypothetical protein